MLRSLALALLTIPAVLGRGTESPPVPAVENHPRNGLPNFFAKTAHPEGEIKVAYLGGSITAQPGWRVKSLAHFREKYPDAKFAEINAAIGGTGSDLGVFRVKQDVLDHQPDLLFVEFAVNDSGTPPEQIIRCMEGIVRQTWRAWPMCEICFVYTITESSVAPLIEGSYQRSASAMDRVAEHYGIPSIHLGMEVAALARKGKLVWRAPLPKTEAEKSAAGDKFIFAADGVHPHVSTGHELYLEAIVRSLEPIHAASGAATAHRLTEPLVSDNYEHARMIPIDQATLSAGFKRLDRASDPMAKRFTRLAALHRADRAGETISFKFRGTRAAIYDVIGPDCGQVTVSLDDKPARVVPRFDAYCTYPRLSTLVIGSDLPHGEHIVKLEVHPEQPDKAKILAQRNQTIDQPERYDGTAFYPGAILLLGELVK